MTTPIFRLGEFSSRDEFEHALSDIKGQINSDDDRIDLILNTRQLEYDWIKERIDIWLFVSSTEKKGS